MKIAALWLLPLLAAGAARAAIVDPAAVDRAAEAERERQQIPGLAVLVVEDGKTVVAKGYGLANVELSVPVSPETLFQTGSVGKMFTAALVMQQVEKGRVKLDVPIKTYFPEAPPAWDAVTVRHLLNHTSGIPNFTEAMYREVMLGTEADLGNYAMKLPLDFPPGARWSYSNTGYVMLGLLVRRVTGRFYGDVLVDDVFKPLGMPTARNISESEITPNRAGGYQLSKGKLANQDYMPQLLNSTADGSLYMALADYAAWDKAVNNGGLLSKASWAEVFKPARLTSGRDVPYGFGWNLGFAGGAPYRGHGGSWQGFKTYFAHYDRDRLTVVVLTNLADADPEKVVQAVTKAIDPQLVVKLPCKADKPAEPCRFGPETAK